MRKVAIAGLAAVSVVGGSVAVAVAVPAGLAIAQDTPPTTTTASGASSGSAARVGKGLDGVLGSLVTDGTITQDQADKIKARFGEAAAKVRPNAGAGLGAPGRPFGAQLDEIASFLGLTTADLTTQLKTKSLGDIAGAKKADLITMLTNKATARVDDGVTKGKITKDQADKIKAQIATRVASMVDAVGGKGFGGFGGFGPAHGRGGH